MARRRIPTIVLDLPTSVPELIGHGRHVVVSTKSSTKLQSVWPAADKLAADLDTLADSEAAARGGGDGLIEQRDLDLETVKIDFELVRVGVIAAAAADPANAEVIVSESGLRKKRLPGHPKNGPEVTFPGGGKAHVRVKAVKRGASYEWEISLDGGQTFVPAGTTTRADQFFSGLTPGVTYEVRWRTTIGFTTSDWGQAFRFMMR